MFHISMKNEEIRHEPQGNGLLNKYLSPVLIHVPINHQNPSLLLFSSTIYCSFPSCTGRAAIKLNQCHQLPSNKSYLCEK